jgi:RecA-family ATPase
MSLLAQASSGVLMRPQVYLIYGPNGVGKTTLASAFDQAIMLDLENGSGFISGITRLTPEVLVDFDAVDRVVDELLSGSQFKTLIIDSLESLETLIQQRITAKHNASSIEDIPYGKGLVMAREDAEELMKKLHRLRDQRQMNIVIVAHSQTKTFTDPNQNVAYDRYMIRANEKLANVVKDLSDSIFFITYKVETITQAGKEKVKAYSSNERVIHTRWSSGFDAKSRFPVEAEIVFDLSKVSDVVKRIQPSAPEDLCAQIENLLPQIADAATREKASVLYQDNKSNIQKLVAIKQRLETLKGST